MSKCASCQLACWLGDVAFTHQQELKIMCFACVPNVKTYKSRGFAVSEITQVVSSVEIRELIHLIER